MTKKAEKLFTEAVEQILTEATGSALRNLKINEDFILGYVSSKVELTDDVKSEVKKCVEIIKSVLVKHN